jgi:hypothetical protein
MTRIRWTSPHMNILETNIRRSIATDTWVPNKMENCMFTAPDVLLLSYGIPCQFVRCCRSVHSPGSYELNVVSFLLLPAAQRWNITKHWACGLMTVGVHLKQKQHLRHLGQTRGRQKPDRTGTKQSSACCILHAAFSNILLWPSRWGQYASLKHQLTFTGPDGVITQNKHRTRH